MHLVSWDTITTPKSIDDLGMQIASIKNDTLLASLAWRLHSNPSSLWAQVVLKKKSQFYYLVLHPLQNLEKIQKVWSLCHDAIQWSIHNGQKVNAWKDRWIPHLLSLCNIIQGPLPNPHPPMQLPFFWHNEVWNLSSFSFDIFSTVKSCIANTFFPNIQFQYDTPLWILTGKGLFSCKTAYQFLVAQRHHPSHNHLWLEWIWKLQLPSKLKFILWILHHNNLPTRATLA